MKKLILIILLISLCLSYINFTVLAEVNFGKWEKWDQKLPDMNNKYWSWAFPGEKSTMLTLDDKLLLITTYLYFGTSKNRASVIFYSPASQKEKIKKDYIPGPKFALVCFPPEKKKSVIRVYEIKNIEEGLSQFLEEWEIPFNQYQDGVPKGVKFRENFKEWLNQQAPAELAESLKAINQENILDTVLPKLRIDNKGKFKLVPLESENNFYGFWVNKNTGKPNITKVDIDKVGNIMLVRIWGKCHPTDCDWGIETTDISDASDGTLNLVWDQGFAIKTQELILLSDGRLKVKTFCHFTDNSGRTDYKSTEYFIKEY